MRPLLAAAAALAGAAGLVLVPSSLAGEDRGEAGSPPPWSSPASIPPTPGRPAAAAPVSPVPAGPLLRAAPVRLTSPGFAAWALLDTGSAAITGSPNLDQASDTASLIKPWLAADYLRRTAERGQQPTAAMLAKLSLMIRDSDNEVAEDVYRLLGGSASIRRLISICQLTEGRAMAGFWSLTRVSARDAVRMGRCLQDGRGAGTRWTGWLLTEMRAVRGVGRFGVIEALPAAVAAGTAIKNGWLFRPEDGLWHVNCLAIGDGWVLAVLLRYPGSLGLAHGEGVCRSVAEQLIAAPAAPPVPPGAGRLYST